MSVAENKYHRCQLRLLRESELLGLRSMCAKSWVLSKAEVLLSAGRYLPFSGVLLLSLISQHVIEVSPNVVKMKSVGNLISTNFPAPVTAALSIYLWYYSSCTASYYSMVKFCHIWLCIPLKTWIHLCGDALHPADPANTQPCNAAQFLQPCGHFHVLQPAVLEVSYWGALNGARESRKITSLRELWRSQIGVSRATALDGCCLSSSCRRLRKKTGPSLDLATIAPNIFTPSCWLQCFTALFTWQETMLLLIPCLLSEANRFVVIQTWFWKQLGKIHKSPKSKNSTNTLLLLNYFPTSIYFIS